MKQIKEKEKEKENGTAATGRRRRSILKAQKRATAILLVCVILLGVGLGVATYFVNRIIFTDIDGLKYNPETGILLTKTAAIRACSRRGFSRSCARWRQTGAARPSSGGTRMCCCLSRQGSASCLTATRSRRWKF